MTPQVERIVDAVDGERVKRTGRRVGVRSDLRHPVHGAADGDRLDECLTGVPRGRVDPNPDLSPARPCSQLLLFAT